MPMGSLPFEPLLKGMEPGIQQMLEQSAKPLECSAQRIILRPEEIWRHCYWVSSGAVRLYYLDRDGKEHNKAFFVDGEFFWPVTQSLQAKPCGFLSKLFAKACSSLGRFPALKRRSRTRNGNVFRCLGWKGS